MQCANVAIDVTSNETNTPVTDDTNTTDDSSSNNNGGTNTDNSVKLVAIGYTTILTSTDGESWNTLTHNFDINFYKVKYYNSAFWITGSKGNILKSTDGLTWINKTGTDFPDRYFQDIHCEGNNCKVAGLNGVPTPSQGTILSTTDGGETWTEENPNTSFNQLQSVIYSGNTTKPGWYSVGYNGSITRLLNIASGWASTGTDYSNGDPLSGVLEFNNFLYAIDYDGHLIRSADGDTWTNNIGGSLASPTGPCDGRRAHDFLYSGSNIIMFCRNDSSNTQSVYTSTNMENWTDISPANDASNTYRFIWGGEIYDDHYYVVTNHGKIGRRSFTGNSWTELTSGTSTALYDIAGKR